MAAWSQLVLSKALEITLEGHRAGGARKGLSQSSPPIPTTPMCPLPHLPRVFPWATHWSQTISRVPGVGGKLSPVAALAEPHPRRGPMPLGLLLTDPQELEMPSLVAQDHYLGGGNTDSGRPL